MKLPDNDKMFDYAEPPDKYLSLRQRIYACILIAIPCLMCIFGLLAGIIRLDASNEIYGIGGYLPMVIVVGFIALSYALFRNNPRLRRASMLTLRPYAESVRGLDEREKLVIDQAFRTSYRVIGLICFLVLVCMIADVQTVRLPYHPGAMSFFYIAFGVIGLLIYLPMAIVAWKEEI